MLKKFETLRSELEDIENIKKDLKNPINILKYQDTNAGTEDEEIVEDEIEVEDDIEKDDKYVYRFIKSPAKFKNLAGVV
jgi:hypothetical protein